MFFFTSQLSRTLGLRGTVMLFANYYVTAKILRFATPAFGRLAAIERGLEGDYRASISRVGRESEEVAYVVSRTFSITLPHYLLASTTAALENEISRGQLSKMLSTTSKRFTE